MYKSIEEYHNALRLKYELPEDAEIRTVPVKISAKNIIETGEFEAYLSVEKPDRYDETVDIDSIPIDDFENGVRTLKIMYQHDGWSPYTFPIGSYVKILKGVWTDGVTKALIGQGYVSDASEWHKTIRRLMADGSLDEFSISFYIREINIDKENEKTTLFVKELLEASVVKLPANLWSQIKAAENIDDSKLADLNARIAELEEELLKARKGEEEEVREDASLKVKAYRDKINQAWNKGENHDN